MLCYLTMLEQSCQEVMLLLMLHPLGWRKLRWSYLLALVAKIF